VYLAIMVVHLAVSLGGSALVVGVSLSVRVIAFLYLCFILFVHILERHALVRRSAAPARVGGRIPPEFFIFELPPSLLKFHRNNMNKV
jgi:hypothetical protein